MNEEKQQDSGLKDKVLKEIESKEVFMRPKLYFTLRIAILAILALSALVVTVFIINFIFFSIRLSSQDILLGFGPKGFVFFLKFFPWGLLLLDVILIILSESLMRQFKFGYKVPALRLMLFIFLAAVIIGAFLDHGTVFNDQMLLRARDRHLPAPFADFYNRAAEPPGDAGFCLCKVAQISGNELLVFDARSSTTLRVILPADDNNATTSGLKVGDRVLVAGDEDDGVIQAFGVKTLPPQAHFRLMRFIDIH